jgi:hypothetical protein
MTATATGTPAAGASPKDASYLLGSRSVAENRHAVLRQLGNGRLNGDGTADVLFVLTQHRRLARSLRIAALQTSAGWVGTTACCWAIAADDAVPRWHGDRT